MGRNAAKRADRTRLFDVFFMVQKYRSQVGIRSMKLRSWEK